MAIDWVGFGDRPRPPLRWSPEIYRCFLAYLLNEVVPRPFATIAAGQRLVVAVEKGTIRHACADNYVKNDIGNPKNTVANKLRDELDSAVRQQNIIEIENASSALDDFF